MKELDDFQKLYGTSVEKKEKVILLDVQRGRGTYTAAMKVSYDE